MITTMTTLAPAVTAFPDRTYAIMVHKLYVERVKDFLLLNGNHWNQKTTSINSDDGFHEETPSRTNSSHVRVLHTPDLKGVSRARRGFVLLFIQETSRPIHMLPPMARQNISWAGKITHQSNDLNLIWNTMLTDGFQVEHDLLRVDVYPREKIEAICEILQSCASTNNNTFRRDPLTSDPFEGPIQMTKSASNCSHRLTVVCLHNNDNSKNEMIHNQSTCYWGLMTRQSNNKDGDNIEDNNHDDTKILTMKLNHDAANEIQVEAADSSSGLEVKPNIQVTAPLSRAYYKLDQVWHDYLLPEIQSTASSVTVAALFHQGTAVDLGACPGGWTQVLVHTMGVARVVAVDPGQPADRILRLKPKVMHEKTDIATMNLNPYHPISILVCDASVVWMEVMKQIQQSVVVNQVGDNKKNKWMLPCIWVITMKLPFKTLGSIERHVDMMHENIPPQLSECAQVMYSNGQHVKPMYQIVHLMANSDSERTLIVVFEKVVI